MRTIKLATGSDVTLDGDLLSVLETLYRDLNAGELQGSAGGGCLPVQVHETADRRAVDVANRRQVHDHLPLA